MTSTEATARSDDNSRAVIFTVAQLALWAGDLAGAEARLHDLAHSDSRQVRKTSVFEQPIQASARRELRQLRRRRTELRALAAAAGISDHVDVPRPLESSGKHVTAILWVEGDHNYEMRAYLNDLSWEGEFYKSAGILSDDRVAMKSIRELGYGSDHPNTKEDRSLDDRRSDSSLGVSWVKLIGLMFLQIELGDFCTITARGVWLQGDPPHSTKVIEGPFQELLDQLDPAPTRARG